MRDTSTYTAEALITYKRSRCFGACSDEEAEKIIRESLENTPQTWKTIGIVDRHLIKIKVERVSEEDVFTS